MASSTAKHHRGRGREQRRKSRTARARTPDLSRFYRHSLPSITPGAFEFELDVLRAGQPPLRLRTVDALSWDDEQSVLTGNLTAYRPDPETPASLPLTRGQLVRCRVAWDGQRYELWTMRAKAPQIQVDTGNVSVDLEDDLAAVDTGRRDWWFRRTKRRRHGYTCDEIAREVGRTLGVPVRRVAAGTHRMELRARHATGLDVLRRAYTNERQHSGRSFVIRWRDGLEIVPLARNPVAYVLSRQIQTALITQKGGASQPVTVLTGRGHTGDGKHARQERFTAYDRRAVRLLGYRHDTKDYGKVASAAELRAVVRRDLAQGLRLNDSASIEHAGIPFIVRGDGVQLDLPREGYKGPLAWVFCTRATHTVQAGTYTSQFDFAVRDPFLAQQQADARAQAQRALKRSRRDRNLTGKGAWITVDATFYGVADSGGPPACGGDFSYNGGMFYAELGFSGGAGVKMGPLFGMAELPCGFPLEVRNPANGRRAFARKHDTGAGAPGAQMDCWHVLADAIGFTSIGHGPLQIRRAG